MIAESVSINFMSVQEGYISYCILKVNPNRNYNLENEYPELVCMPYFRLSPENVKYPYLEGYANWELKQCGDFGKLPMELLSVLVSLLDCKFFHELTQTCKVLEY